jgi:hypothetical protein
MIEKRRYKRLGFKNPVTLRHVGRMFPAWMLDLSSGGMLIRSDNLDISSGAPVEVIFDLEGAGKDLSMLGNVKHLTTTDDSSTFGIQFSNAFSESLKALRGFLNLRLG